MMKSLIVLHDERSGLLTNGAKVSLVRGVNNFKIFVKRFKTFLKL